MAPWIFMSSPAAEEQVADRVSELAAAPLELGGRSFDQAAARLFPAGKSVLDPRGVIGPVGGGVEHATRLEFFPSQGNEWKLHEPALVVPLLRPGIGKEEMDRRERLVRDHLLQDFGRVVTHDAQVLDIFCLNLI